VGWHVLPLMVVGVLSLGSDVVGDSDGCDGDACVACVLEDVDDLADGVRWPVRVLPLVVQDRGPR